MMWSIIRCAAAAGLLVVAFYSASVQLTTKNTGRRLRAAEGGDAHGRMLQTACDISGAYTFSDETGHIIEQTGGDFILNWAGTDNKYSGQVNDDCTGTIDFSGSVNFAFNPSTLDLVFAVGDGITFHQVVPTSEPTPEPVTLTPEPTALVIGTPTPTTLAPPTLTPEPTAAVTPMPTAADTPTPTVGACATTAISGTYIPELTADTYTLLLQPGSTFPLSITLSIGDFEYAGTFDSDCTGTVTFAEASVEAFVYQSASGNLEFTLQNGNVVNFVLQDGSPPVSVVDTPMPTMMDTPMPTMIATQAPTPEPTPEATPEPTKAPRVRQVMIKMRDARMCLDAKERNTKNGAMHMWPCERENKNQHWDYTKATGQLKLHDGFCLEFKALEDKAKVATFPCKDGKDGQYWQYKKGQFRALASSDGGNFCLDAIKGTDAGGKVVLTKCKKIKNEPEMEVE